MLFTNSKNYRAVNLVLIGFFCVSISLKYNFTANHLTSSTSKTQSVLLFNFSSNHSKPIKQTLDFSMLLLVLVIFWFVLIVIFKRS